MSQFIDECRSEWKRLRVPATIADEMADDLTADLAEAEAEGASAEDVLGRGASDPRAFAAAWASERGIVRPRRRSWMRRSWIVVIAVLLLILGVFAIGVIAVFTSSSTLTTTHNTVAVLTPQHAKPAFVSDLPGSAGTAIMWARLPPAEIPLNPARKTVVHRRPETVSITFDNSGRVLLGLVTLVVHVNRHIYLRRARNMHPGQSATVRIALPKDLPRDFTISARTRPVRNETVLTNNTQTWHVTIRK
jgi:hypothetical protein